MDNQQTTIQTSQNSSALPWYKKYWQYIVFAFLVIVTGGMYAAMQAKQKQTKTTDAIDDLDKEIIADKIVDVNQLDQKIDQATDKAETISKSGNQQIQDIKAQAEVKPVEEQVTDLNQFMKDRR
jgi:TolA-binding protein